MKRYIFLLVLFIGMIVPMQAQTVLPQFPGGKKAMDDYILSNFVIAGDKFVQGEQPVVRVKFLVSKIGEISNVSIVRKIKGQEQPIFSVDYENELIKFIENMPNWVPGKKNKRKQAMYRTIDVDFKKVSFSNVEQLPQFPGGEEEMYKFINWNLKYPVIAQESGIQGKVIVGFTVLKDGTASDIQILRGIDTYCDREAIRVVKMMPKWIPAKQNGIPAKVSYFVPIIFKLKN